MPRAVAPSVGGAERGGPHHAESVLSLLARRNLTAYQRAELALALALEAVLRPKAKDLAGSHGKTETRLDQAGI